MILNLLNKKNDSCEKLGHSNHMLYFYLCFQSSKQDKCISVKSSNISTVFLVSYK